MKDEEGKLKYICTDPSRQVFQYKNEDGKIQKDVRVTKLTKALFDTELKKIELSCSVIVIFNKNSNNNLTCGKKVNTV